MKRLADVEKLIEHESRKKHKISPDTEVNSAASEQSEIRNIHRPGLEPIQLLAQEMFQTLAKNDAKEYFEVRRLTDRPTDSNRQCYIACF